MLKSLSIATFIAMLFVSGCDMFSSPSADIPDDELRSKWRECKYIKNPSRTKVLACENYQRECDKRKNKGNLACY